MGPAWLSHPMGKRGQPGLLMYIANHMSLLETLILPGIALAFTRVMFVIKEEPLKGNRKTEIGMKGL